MEKRGNKGSGNKRRTNGMNGKNTKEPRRSDRKKNRELTGMHQKRIKTRKVGSNEEDGSNEKRTDRTEEKGSNGEKRIKQ
jgi:hypothetical protein